MTEVKVEVLIQKLISEDKRKNEIRGNSKSSDSDQAFHMKKFSKNKGKTSDSEEKLKKVKCYNCNKLGHYSTSCSLPKKKSKREKCSRGQSREGLHFQRL